MLNWVGNVTAMIQIAGDITGMITSQEKRCTPDERFLFQTFASNKGLHC